MTILYAFGALALALLPSSLPESSSASGEGLSALVDVAPGLVADKCPEVAAVGRDLFVSARAALHALEAAMLACFTPKLFESIPAMVAPMPSSRGPPADVVAPAPAKSPGGFKSLYRTGAPSMVSDTRKAPLRALSQTFHPAACPAQTAYQPRTLCAVVCCAAGPNRDGRYVLAVD